MTTAWSHLPNAVHIDRVLASVKAHPGVWSSAWYAASDWSGDRARAAASDAERTAARTAAWDAARDAERTAARTAARDEVRYAAWDAASAAARGAISALIAYDNSAKFLDMTSNELKMWGALSEDPAAILMLPAVIAFEKISELELT